ncbi:hypothetical protein PR048_009188 [Dryococelus australis]|uniref:Uncharacterized protein n=1 Tax=Dryococelus australis TaxID=614101 RepID=A0ABQ9HZK0_9NEOP|nr:hypothetical protein PR048_009188 [Dryococelus australis]
MNIHAITCERIRRLTTLLIDGKVPVDRRGKCTPGNTKLDCVDNAVEEHISSFPHYLSERLNVLLMYRLFKASHPDANISYKFYLKVFNENFSLSFGVPRLTPALHVKNFRRFLADTAKRVHAGEKMIHLRRSKKTL